MIYRYHDLLYTYSDNGGTIDGHGRHAAGPRVDGGGPGSLLEERGEFGTNLAGGGRIGWAWSRKVTQGFANAMISTNMEFLV